MGTLLALVGLILGILLLWKAGEISVSSAIEVSIIYRIQSFVIGFFLFAVATGLPELTSAIVSSLEKVPELSSGDLIGSAFVNLSLQLGVAIFVARCLPIEEKIRDRLIQTTAAVLLIMVLLLFFSKANLYLGVALMAIYPLSYLWLPKKEPLLSEEMKGETIKKNDLQKLKVILKLFLGLAVLVASAWLTVISAVVIAKAIHIPVVVIGGTLIAIGTSLPELVLEVHAVRRKEYALALGDIFGSSLLNISFILGLLIVMNTELVLSLPRIIFPFFFLGTLLIFYHLFSRKPFQIYDGVVFIFLFAIYTFRVSMWRGGVL